MLWVENQPGMPAPLPLPCLWPEIILKQRKRWNELCIAIFTGLSAFLGPNVERPTYLMESIYVFVLR